MGDKIRTRYEECYPVDEVVAVTQWHAILSSPIYFVSLFKLVTPALLPLDELGEIRTSACPIALIKSENERAFVRNLEIRVRAVIDYSKICE
jgi:hypothetical protein